MFLHFSCGSCLEALAFLVEMLFELELVLGSLLLAEGGSCMGFKLLMWFNEVTTGEFKRLGSLMWSLIPTAGVMSREVIWFESKDIGEGD